MDMSHSAPLMGDLVSGSSGSDAMDITLNESKQAEPEVPTNTSQVQPTLAADFFKQIISTANAEKLVSQPAECIDGAVGGSRSSNISAVIDTTIGCMSLSLTCMDKESSCDHLSCTLCSHEDTSLPEHSSQPTEPRLVEVSSPSHPRGDDDSNDGSMPLSFTCMDHHTPSSNGQNHTLYTNQNTDLQNSSPQLKVVSASSLSKAHADDGAQCTMTTEKMDKCSIQKKPKLHQEAETAHDQSRTQHNTDDPTTVSHSVACDPSEHRHLQHKKPLFPYKFHSRPCVNTSAMARSIPIGDLSQFGVPRPLHSSLAVSSLLSSKSPSLTHLLVSKKEATKAKLPFPPQPKECDEPELHKVSPSEEVFSSSHMSLDTAKDVLQAPVSPVPSRSEQDRNLMEEHPDTVLNESDQPDPTNFTSS